MILNEFLQVRLGVHFEDKYNALAVKEILCNKEMYPLIVDTIQNEMENAEDLGKTWDFESGFFDCDDIEFCADYNDTMELYRAFVRAFFNDKRDKPLNLKYISFGVDYMRLPDTSCIMDPCFHYLGTNFVLISPKKTTLVRNIYYPFYSNEEYFGHISTEEYVRTFFVDNRIGLKNIEKEVKALYERKALFANRFESENMERHSVPLENGKIGYPCDCYEICVGKNVLRFFSTERGFDVYSILRPMILESLDEEQRENKVVKFIEEITF